MSEFGPDRQSDAYPLTDRAEVVAARRILIPRNPGAGYGPSLFLDGALDALAARDVQEWGTADPFGEG